MEDSPDDTDYIPFAPTDKVDPYRDISRTFFPIIGREDVAFFSNESRLSMFALPPDLTLSHIRARIHEFYDVDVSDIDLLVDVFERIKDGSYYQEYLKPESPG